MSAQREWFEKDYYQVLGVSSTASDKEITQAYRKLAKQFHPDANPGSEDRFKEISSAYDVLGDHARRKEYDEVRRLGPLAGGFGAGGTTRSGGFGSGGSGTFRTADLGDLGDLFGGLFGGSRTGGTRRTTTQRRGRDVEATLNLSFRDAVLGVTTSVNVPQDEQCHICNGSGATPGTGSHICTQCGGKGTLDDNQGLFSLSTVCPRCNGRGTVVDNPCSNCQGTGVERRNRSVKVRIPPGVEDGQRIRVKGRGSPGQGGAPKGDLYVVVRVGKDTLFGRRGRNLTLSVPVTFPEAALGTTITVPTLDDPVTLRVPPGTSSGALLRVRGRGVPSNGGNGAKGTSKPGDLIVKIDVVVPSSLSEEQRGLIESLAALADGSPREYLRVGENDDRTKSAGAN